MESARRSLFKTLSWRLIATVVTASIATWMTDSWEVGIAMGTADTTLKLVLYFVHERAWAKVSIGYQPAQDVPWTSPTTSTPTAVPVSAPPSNG